MSDLASTAPLPLPETVRSRYVPDVNGLSMHILEAGWEGERPLVILLHGFPELAFSWRKLIAPLAQAGFHVVASDQRGYGRTTGWDGGYDGDLASFRMQPATARLNGSCGASFGCGGLRFEVISWRVHPRKRKDAP